jgi:enterochelin esterase-like enzyme
MFELKKIKLMHCKGIDMLNIVKLIGRKWPVVALLSLATLVAPTSYADWFLRGSANAWQAQAMSDLGAGQFHSNISFHKEEVIARFKIDRFADWTESYPSQDLIVDACSEYNILFNANSKAIVLEKVGVVTDGDCSINDAWFYRGSSNAWAATVMSAIPGTTNFTLDVAFEKQEADARFKIDHFSDWTESYPTLDFAIDDCAEYTIVFDSVLKTIVATKLRDILTGACSQPGDDDWFFRGTANGWQSTKMTQIGATDHYELTVAFKNQEGPARFKIDHFGDWLDTYPALDFAVDDCAEYRIRFNRNSKVIEVDKLASIVGDACNGADNTVLGDVRILDVTMPQLGNISRKVRVLLPTDYAVGERRYPVLYMHDGHNLFDKNTSAFGNEWYADEILDLLFSSGEHSGVIVVGIDSAPTAQQRYQEYTGWDWTHPSLGFIDAKGALHAAFVVDNLLPLINSRYRTLTDRDNTGIAGSSMGAYMAIYTGIRYQTHFSKIAAVSLVALDDPMHGYELRDYVRAADPSLPMRVYTDIGTDEQLSYTTAELLVESNTKMCAALQVPFSEVTCRTIVGGQHNEAAWAARFGDIYLHLFAGKVL